MRSCGGWAKTRDGSFYATAYFTSYSRTASATTKPLSDAQYWPRQSSDRAAFNRRQSQNPLCRSPKRESQATPARTAEAQHPLTSGFPSTG